MAKIINRGGSGVSSSSLLTLRSYENGPTGVAKVGLHTQTYPKIRGFNGGPLTQTQAASLRDPAKVRANY